MGFGGVNIRPADGAIGAGAGGVKVACSDEPFVQPLQSPIDHCFWEQGLVVGPDSIRVRRPTCDLANSVSARVVCRGCCLRWGLAEVVLVGEEVLLVSAVAARSVDWKGVLTWMALQSLVM